MIDYQQSLICPPEHLLFTSYIQFKSTVACFQDQEMMSPIRGQPTGESGSVTKILPPKKAWQSKFLILLDVILKDKIKVLHFLKSNLALILPKVQI